MIPGLLPIPLKELKVLSTPKVWNFEGYLEELPSLTPVRGTLIVDHQGKKLKIKGNFSTIVNLICDRCLVNFNQTLTFESEEFIGIGKENNFQKDLQLDECAEYISPLKSFDPQRWVFEQLNLQLPLLKSCGIECFGPFTLNSKNQISSNEPQYNDLKTIDARWSELKKLLNP